MSDKGWFNQAVELKVAKRYAEADELELKHTILQDQAEARETIEQIKEVSRLIATLRPAFKQYKLSKKNSNPEIRYWWSKMATQPLEFISQFWRLIPNSRARGRPLGSYKYTTAQLVRMHDHIVSGMKETPAARLVLSEDGVLGELRGKARHLVLSYRAHKSTIKADDFLMRD